MTLTADKTAPAADPAARPTTGLARYFPGLRREPGEAPKVVARSRPSWFGLRSPKPAGTQTYMTDARGQLNRPGPEPTALPVALQVPSERASSDRMVTPTNAESPRPDGTYQAKPAGESGPKPTVDDTVADIPDFGGKPSRPGEDEVNPLPPAAEPDAPVALANRMPGVPSVDPIDEAQPDKPTPTPGGAAPDDHAIKVSTPSAESSPPAEPTKPMQQATTQVVETSKSMPAASKVLPSPQSATPKPTSQAKPSPQGVVSTGEKTWKRPCLRRLVRRVCKLGEYADPPTAAPH